MLENETLQSEKLNTKVKRESNFELLRIIAMLLIVMHHFAVHGGYTGNVPAFNQAIIDFLIIGGKVGVNLYVLISGYFLINSTFKIKKLLTLVLETIVYSLIIYLLLCLFGEGTFDFNGLINSFLGFRGYWFVATYIVMYAFSPFINKMIKALTQKEHLLLIMCLLIFNITVPFIPNYWDWGLSFVAWFITLYVIAAYLRLYQVDLLSNKWLMLTIFILSYAIIAIFNMFFNKSLWDMKEIMCIISSLSLFCFFKNINIKYNKVINIISSTTFGIYLIHDNVMFKSVLWIDILKCPEYAFSNYFILYAIACILGVFICCSLIDLLRQLIFKGISKIKIKKKELNS